MISNEQTIRVIEKMEKKIHTIEVPIGAGASGGLLSLPFWVEQMTPWLEFIILVCGAIVGILTVIIYLRKVFGGNKDDKQAR